MAMEEMNMAKLQKPILKIKIKKIKKANEPYQHINETHIKFSQFAY
jgi:hypothetical protein